MRGRIKSGPGDSKVTEFTLLSIRWRMASRRFGREDDVAYSDCEQPIGQDQLVQIINFCVVADGVGVGAGAPM
jgi:hypothetical protein